MALTRAGSAFRPKGAPSREAKSCQQTSFLFQQIYTRRYDTKVKPINIKIINTTSLTSAQATHSSRRPVGCKTKEIINLTILRMAKFYLPEKFEWWQALRVSHYNLCVEPKNIVVYAVDSWISAILERLEDFNREIGWGKLKNDICALVVLIPQVSSAHAPRVV